MAILFPQSNKEHSLEFSFGLFVVYKTALHNMIESYEMIILFISTSTNAKNSTRHCYRQLFGKIYAHFIFFRYLVQPTSCDYWYVRCDRCRVIRCYWFLLIFWSFKNSAQIVVHETLRVTVIECPITSLDLRSMWWVVSCTSLFFYFSERNSHEIKFVNPRQ